MNAYTKRYYERKKQGLCVRCGEQAIGGKTRCKLCSMIDAMRMRSAYHNWPMEKRIAKQEYIKRWSADHPERVAVYKARKSEYNRRYEEKI